MRTGDRDRAGPGRAGPGTKTSSETVKVWVAHRCDRHEARGQGKAGEHYRQDLPSADPQVPLSQCLSSYAVISG